MFIYDQRYTSEKALRQGLKQVLELGKEEGRLETKLEIAKQLIDMLDNEAIARTTGLSVDEVAQLRNS
jgi:predicted transposase/invertase (TIGR01784 family)